jgi:CheY-like chemotaxis protein
VAPSTVLIADDEPHVLLLVVMTLRKEGYRIVEAQDGAEALALARSEQPDVVILDASMPELSGFEVCEALRADASIARQPYVLMLTAAGQDDDRRRAGVVGVDAFKTKPFSPSALRQHVREVVTARAAAAGGDTAPDASPSTP